MTELDYVAFTLFYLPGWWYLWVATILAFGLFGRRLYALVSLFLKSRPDNRWDQPLDRFKHFAVYVLAGKRILNDPLIGMAHLLIFWGFVVYVPAFLWNLMRGLLPFLPLPYTDQIGSVSLLLEVFAVLVLAGLLVAALRRAFFPPEHLTQSRDAVIILGLITLLIVCALLGDAFLIMTGHDSVSPAWKPLGSPLAAAFSGSPFLVENASRLATAMWWLHMLTVLAFLAYLPYSKHAHLLFAPFNVLFGNLRPAGDLGVIGPEEETLTGASRLEEFSWRQLMGPFACAECGRCDRVCPALNSGLALSPQQVFHQLKEYIRDTVLNNHKPQPAPVQVGEYISEAVLWSCTTCYACMECCAVMNEHIPLIVNMRRHLVSQGAVEQTMQVALENLGRYGNSFGQSERARPKWTQGLETKVKDARKEAVEYLWFVGDYAAYDPRMLDITRTTARIFQAANLDFGIIYEAERNSGNDARRVGEEGLFQSLRETNLAALQKARYRTLVTTDPHTYNTLKNEYALNSNGVSVVHYTELLDRLIQEGKLVLTKHLGIGVTYHDPCYLGRYNGVYEPPRRVLRALGVNLKEMPRSRNLSYCCGAGGGRIWMKDVAGVKERPADSRVREAAALEGVRVLVTACPKDVVMFRDALKAIGQEGRMEVKDLAELVWEAMQEEKKEVAANANREVASSI